MLIDKKITKKIAFLARIELNDKEEEEFSKDLSNILQWMEDLKKVDRQSLQDEIWEKHSFENWKIHIEDAMKKTIEKFRSK